MADIHGSPGAAPQMPAAPNSGPAPVPYQGADLSPEPPLYGVTAVGFPTMGSEVMSGVSSAMGVQESDYAHDVNAGLCTPYYAGDISPINTLGTPDDVSGTVAGSVAAAEARFTSHQQATFGPGNDIGDLMNVPQNSLDPAVGSLGPLGSYYDPPRDY